MKRIKKLLLKLFLFITVISIFQYILYEKKIYDYTYTKAESTFISRLLKENSSDFPQSASEDFQSFFTREYEKKQNFHTILYKTEKGLRGFASYYYPYNSESNHAYLKFLIIDEPYRGRRTGSILLMSILKTLKNSGCKTIEARIGLYAYEGRALLERIGYFKEVSRDTLEITYLKKI